MGLRTRFFRADASVDVKGNSVVHAMPIELHAHLDKTDFGFDLLQEIISKDDIKAMRLSNGQVDGNFGCSKGYSNFHNFSKDSGFLSISYDECHVGGVINLPSKSLE